jgi:RNA polymerase sigma-70 factor (ECF subfamily)
MQHLSQAEQYLLEQIRRGDDTAWTQFVGRYHGRLVVYARQKMSGTADCEDIVQETFVSFIRYMNAFRGQCSLESYLFTILRTKIVDYFRRAENSKSGRARKMSLGDSEGQYQDFFASIASSDPTASSYMRRDESRQKLMEAFSQSLLGLLDDIKKSLSFERLKIVEMLFFCQVSNVDAAEVLKISPSQIGVIKHRCIKQIQGTIDLQPGVELSDADTEGIIAQVWRDCRPSCPKRNTIGAYHLGTLEPEWKDYVDFHLHQLGCQFCLANLRDIEEQNKQKDSSKLCRKIMESTVGFLKKP